MIQSELTVLGSPNGRKNYEVTLCCSPSCTCPDYKKNRKNLLCKHIMFTFLHGLKLEGEAFLNQIYISEKKLRKLRKLQRDINKIYKFYKYINILY